jgi:hypothetical protein
MLPLSDFRVTVSAAPLSTLHKSIRSLNLQVLQMGPRTDRTEVNTLFGAPVVRRVQACSAERTHLYADAQCGYCILD